MRRTLLQAALLMCVFFGVTVVLIALGADLGLALTAGHAAFAVALVAVLVRF